MPRTLMFFVLVVASSLAAAQTGSIYRDGFDPPSFTQRFPVTGGMAELPATAAADQIQWFAAQLASGANTTTAAVAAHFASTFDAAGIADWINNSLRPFWPNARIVDVVALTPYGGTVVIQGDIAANPYGYINFHIEYASSQHRFTLLSASNWWGSTIYPADQSLTLEQAADKAETLAAGVSVLVARVTPSGQCTPITQRNATTLRATASVFKNWILYGAGRAIAAGEMSSVDHVALTADRFALGGELNTEPVGTPIPVSDLTALMMGNSDNTATDMLHHALGRQRLDAAVDASGVTDADVLKPLLGISEQFQFIYSFPASDWQAYLAGNEGWQSQFVADQIVPRGNIMGSYANFGLLVRGTWQASAMDICAVYAANHRLPQGSEAFDTVDAALAANAGQPNVRNRWDRVWYKGGSLTSTTGQFNILTHAWLLENAGGPMYFVTTLYNDDDVSHIDQYQVQSVAGRILQILADTHP